MQITIRYPWIGALEYRTTIEVEENAKFDDIKDRIYKKFETDIASFMNGNTTFCNRFGSNRIVLKGGDDVIGDDAVLQDKMRQASSLIAFFD